MLKDKRIFFSYIPLVIKDEGDMHSFYKELINNPPVEYYLPKNLAIKKNKSLISLAKKFVAKANFPNYWRVPQGYDLIHAMQHLVVSNTPWVVDIEHVGGFVGFHHERLNSGFCRYLIKKSLCSEKCKKILPWTEAAKKSLYLIGNLKDKAEVVYPAIKSINLPKKVKTDNTNFLFNGKDFLRKGGMETLEAYKRISKKYDNINLTMISAVPDSIQTKHGNVRFIEPCLSREELYSNYYPSADILIMPTYCDTFGMVFLEAMNFKIPIIASDNFAIPEIIEKSGLTVETPVKWYDKNYNYKLPYKTDMLSEAIHLMVNNLGSNKREIFIKGIMEKMEILIENSSLRRKMGEHGKSLVEKGKFSITHRNKQLRRIYEEAIG